MCTVVNPAPVGGTGCQLLPWYQGMTYNRWAGPCATPGTPLHSPSCMAVVDNAHRFGDHIHAGQQFWEQQLMGQAGLEQQQCPGSTPHRRAVWEQQLRWQPGPTQ